MANISNSGNAGGDINQNISTSTSRIVHKHKGNNSVIISIGVVVIVCVIAAFYFMSGGVEKKIVGSWRNVEQTSNDFVSAVFTSDKTVKVYGSNEELTGTYSMLDKNKVLMDFEWEGITMTADVTLKGDNMTLHIIKATSNGINGYEEVDVDLTFTFEKSS